MKRLPSTARLSREVLNRPGGGDPIGDSLDFLRDQQALLAQYEDVESFALDADGDEEPAVPGALFHFGRIREAVARVLWEREFFLGLTVIDHLLFRFITENHDPIPGFFEFIKERGLHRPGFLVYPLHSLGVLGAGLVRDLGDAYHLFSIDRAGITLRPQINRSSRAIQSLDEARRTLDITARLPEELLQHWIRSRPLDWLVQNPILVVKTQTLPGSYYENQPLLLARLRYATTILFMLSTLEEPDDNPLGRIGSTSVINNRQTLDFKHYLVFYPRGGRSRFLTGDCVPMNVRKPRLVETSDMPIELSPSMWRRRRVVRRRVVEAVRTVERGYYRYVFASNRNDVRTRVYRKLHDSLHFFRRSFRQSGYGDETVVSLAIAFEVLLSDNYSRGVDERILRHVRLALRGVRGTRKLQAAVKELYDARSEVVHGGSTEIELDINAVRKTFVHAYIGVVSRLRHLPRESAQPLADLLNQR